MKICLRFAKIVLQWGICQQIVKKKKKNPITRNADSRVNKNQESAINQDSRKKENDSKPVDANAMTVVSLPLIVALGLKITTQHQNANARTMENQTINIEKI